MSTTTPNLGLFKYNTNTDGKEVFSIKTALNDNWDIIDEKCGSGKNIGEIVTSTIPLTDAGLHLLDGSLINGNGSYSQFVTYISGLVSGYPDLFISEADWQTAIGTYGVCGKFVYDSTNNTIRLPKITGIVEGTTDVSALGDLVEAGLPNITGEVKNEATHGLIDTNDINNVSGPFYIGTAQSYRLSFASDAKGYSIGFDASRSNPIYGNSNTVQPQTINVLYYIVIATTTKTDIQVDIDQIATDLNGKCDKADLMECQVVVEDYQSGGSWYRVYSDGWCEQGASGVSITSGQMAIYFLKPFMDNHYTLITEINGVASTSYGEGVSVQSKLTDSFLCHGYHSSAVTAVTADWYACGYIEVA